MNCAIVFPRYSDSLEVEIQDVPVTRRYISLLLMAKGHSRENAETAVKYAESRQKNVRNEKGSCTVGAVMARVRTIPIMGAQARRAISAA